MIKRLVASAFIAVIAVVGVTAPSASAQTSAASQGIDWE